MASAGLDAGVGDYLTKPFALEELHALIAGAAAATPRDAAADAERVGPHRGHAQPDGEARRSYDPR